MGCKIIFQPDIEVRGKTVLVIPAQNGWQTHNVGRGTGLNPLKSRFWNFRTRRLAAMGAAVAASLSVGLPSYWENLQHQDIHQWISHTHLVLETLESFRPDLLTAVANPKAFLLSGNGSYALS
jgi:hypothetical protein